MIPEIYVLVYLFCPKFQVANLIIKFAIEKGKPLPYDS